MEELRKALKTTASGDVLKQGGETLHVELLRLFNACLLSETLPQDFKYALIVTIYKTNGYRAECGNHRGISLLAITGKVLVLSSSN